MELLAPGHGDADDDVAGDAADEDQRVENAENDLEERRGSDASVFERQLILLSSIIRGVSMTKK